MKWLTEDARVVIGMVPQTISNNNVTGRYFDMNDYRRALFIVQDGASAATKETTLDLYQATNYSAGGAKTISGATATITSGTKNTKATAALSSVLAGTTITITVYDYTKTPVGVTAYVFTAHANTTTESSRQFKIDGNDSADAGELAACINDATYGALGVTAVNDTGTITLTSTNPGVVMFTLAQSSNTFTFVQVEAQAFVELDASQLDLANGFRYVAAKVTKTGNGSVGVIGILYRARKTPNQAVAASAYK